MKLINGDCLEELKKLPENSVDSIVTDPPYELNFMGKSWDSTGIAYNVELWKEVLRVLKPGGHLLAFGGSRTYHRMTCAIEDAGFEIRDQIMWVYGSGFPKSNNISKAIDKMKGCKGEVVGSRNDIHGGGVGDWFFYNNVKNIPLITSPSSPEAKQWDGWGSALKPAHEPICLARKPLSESTIAKNVLKWGTGGINIDGSRIGTEEDLTQRSKYKDSKNLFNASANNRTPILKQLGRFPANFILSWDEDEYQLKDNISKEDNKKLKDWLDANT